MSVPTERFGEVIGAITTALKLLGADSPLLAAVGSWRDGCDDPVTLECINEWIMSEKARISCVMSVYFENGCWKPCREIKEGQV